jgi:hypothetical protein
VRGVGKLIEKLDDENKGDDGENVAGRLAPFIHPSDVPSAKRN